MAKVLTVGLLNQVVSSYDSTKTTISGHVSQKTINSQSVLGPTITQFIDTQTTAGVTPSLIKYNSGTGRLFVLSTISASPTILLFNVSVAGVQTYVGKIVITLANLAATTHTIRGFEVDDSGATWQIMLATSGSVAINGGVYLVNALTAADFTPAGATIWAAQGTGQKAVYFLQDDLYKGVANNMTALWGLSKFRVSSVSGIQTKMYAINGSISVPQVLAFEMATTPAIANVITGVSSQSTAFVATSPAAYFTSGTTNPTLVTSDPVILTGTAPTPFTASPANAAQSVQFIRDVQLVAGNYFFNLANTSGGAAVVATQTTSGITLMRAFGTCSNLFYGRTPLTGFTPALSGTIVQTNIVDHAIPTNAPLNNTLNGQDCMAFASTTNLYLGKIADLFLALSGTSTGSIITVSSTTGISNGMAVTGLGITPGTTVSSFTSTTITLSSAVAAAQASPVQFVFGSATWSSLTAANSAGSGTDMVAPAVALMKYSNLLDKFVYVTNTSVVVVKPLQNGLVSARFSNLDNSWLEAPSTAPAVSSGLAAVAGMDISGGIVFLSGNTIGQRGITFSDLYSDRLFGFSTIISPVIAVQAGSNLKYVDSLEQIFDYTNTANYYIRTGASAGDAIFASATGGWVALSKAIDLNYGLTDGYMQLMIDFNIVGSLTTTGAQISDLIYTIQSNSELSENWEYSHDASSSATPTRVAFRLRTAYTSSVPTLRFRAFEDLNPTVGVVNAITTTNAANFQYSTDSGVTWNSLGTIPNTVGTLLRYTFSSPPGVDVRVSIREN